MTTHADRYPDKRIFFDDQGLFDFGDDLALFDGIGISDNTIRRFGLERDAWPFPKTTYFGVSGKQDLNNVSVDVELLVEPSITSEQLKTARCGILWKEYKSHQAPQVFPIHQTDTLHLWLPSLRRGADVLILIGWPEITPEIVYMMITLHSAEGSQRQPWHDAGHILRRRKNPNPPPLKTALLKDICETFETVRM